MNLMELYQSLMESRATEQQAKNVLSKGEVEDVDSALQAILPIDGSKNQKNLPSIAYFYVVNQNLNAIKDVFDKYNELEGRNKLKPMQLTKRGVIVGDKVFLGTEFDDFSKFISQEYNKIGDTNKTHRGKEFEANDKPIWSGNGIDIYDGHDVGRCIKYTMGGITGRGYSFCIGQPGNTMWKSYRDRKTSTFYFIVDKNYMTTNDDGSPNLDNPLHMVVFDNTQHGVELTDVNNTTGSIAEFGSDTSAYINYLSSKGVPVEKMMPNKPKTDQERHEDEMFGQQKYDLEWFKNLSYEDKSKYIGRGHILTNAQFDYLIGAE